MKRIIRIVISIFMLVSSMLSQYWEENVSEKSFEQSDIYFNSYYLNPLGFKNFKSVAAGISDDPFLTIHLNPANFPVFEGSTLIHMDFIGKYKDARTFDDIYPHGGVYYDYYMWYQPYYNYIPMWYENTPDDPQPFLSFGILNYPLGENNKNLYLGATYQVIHKKEKYYSPYFGIYNWQYGYDVFGGRAENMDASYPVTDRYKGIDEMLYNGHFFSAFLGYKLSPAIDAGLSFNGINYSKNGTYQNQYHYDQSNSNIDFYSYFYDRQRNMDYHHLDFSGGLNYHFSDEITAGIKAGILQGKAEQEFFSLDTSAYAYGEIDLDDYWFRSYSHYQNEQNWDHEGKTWYGSVQLYRKLNEKSNLKFYYRYNKSNIDLTNKSVIDDTSSYSNHYYYDPDTSEYTHNSFLRDNRVGTGDRKKKNHQVMISLEFQVSPRNHIIIGAFYESTRKNTYSREPVYALRRMNSTGYSSYYSPYITRYSRELLEDKFLVWEQDLNEWTLQIPIRFDFQINPNWKIMLAVNRIMKNWEINDITTAYYNERTETIDGLVETKENYAERYTMPKESLTDDETDVIAGFEVKISPQLSVDLKMDPEFENSFRIAQWWLTFRAGL